MTERPLCKYEDGQLWKDFGGVYYPTDRFNVVMTRETFLTRTGPDAERYAKDCQAALTEYQKAMEEAK